MDRLLYDSSWVAAVAIMMLGVGAVFAAWGIVSIGLAGAAFALYLALAIEDELIPSPSFYSQLALLVMGISVIFSAYKGIQNVLAEAAGIEPNLVIVIGGFIFLPMIGLLGFAMTCCSIASKRASHGMLVYFATEPSRLNQKLL